MTAHPLLMADDLKRLLALVVRADIKVGDVPTVWLTVQRLEGAVKTGLDYSSFVRTDDEEADGNR